MFFMRAWVSERPFLAYFFGAVATKNAGSVFEQASLARRVKARDGFHKEVRRQQANLAVEYSDERSALSYTKTTLITKSFIFKSKKIKTQTND